MEREKVRFGEVMKALNNYDTFYKAYREKWNDRYIFRYSSHPVNGFLQPAHPNEDYEIIKQTETYGKPGQLYSFIIEKIEGESRYWGKGCSDYMVYTPSQDDLFAWDWIIEKGEQKYYQ